MPARKPIEDVDAFMAGKAHPHGAEIDRLRAIIKAAGPKLVERIKWNAPSYHLGRYDFGAFNLRARDGVQLVVVFPPGTMVADAAGLLTGDYVDRRVVMFHGAEDIATKRAALQVVVREWVGIVEALAG